jgi:hypothetical protein
MPYHKAFDDYWIGRKEEYQKAEISRDHFEDWMEERK